MAINSINLFYLTILLCSMVAGSCEDEHRSAYQMLDTQRDDSSKYAYALDSVVVEVDSAQLNSYSVFCPWSNEVDDYFVGYNPKNNSLNIFDLHARKTVKNIFFRQDGPKAISTVRSVYVQNLDSIFLFTQSNIFLVDTAFNIRKKIRINNFLPDITGVNFSRFNFSSKDPSFRLYYHPQRKSLFIYGYPIVIPYHKPAYYSEHFLYELPIDKLAAAKVPIFYSALYGQKGKFYSGLNMPNVTFNRDTIIYNFPIDPNIYTYDLNTYASATHGGQAIRSKNMPNSLDPEDVGNSDKELRWVVETTIFHQVVFDPYRNLYYRIHDGAIPYEISATSYNSFGDKPYFLSVYNKDFKLIDEISLKKYRYYPDLYFVTKQGLWLSNSSYRNVDQKENELSFDRFLFQPDKKISM